MSKKFIIADNHFGHKGIIKHCHRPFVNNAYPETDKRHWDSDAMDEFMINEWNSVVGHNDLVYHLGDIAYHCKASKLEKIRARLNGKIQLVPGNHDKEALKLPHCWTILPQCAEIHLNAPGIRTDTDHVKVVLCHYALRVWNGSFKGAWHLYGHSHGTLPDIPTALSFDVGVDCVGYKPLSEAEIVAKMVVKIANRARYAPHVRAADGNVYNQGREEEDDETTA